jgi:hypothetical protein
MHTINMYYQILYQTMTSVVAVTYRRRVSPGPSEVRTRGLEMSVLRS